MMVIVISTTTLPRNCKQCGSVLFLLENGGVVNGVHSSIQESKIVSEELFSRETEVIGFYLRIKDL